MKNLLLQLILIVTLLSEPNFSYSANNISPHTAGEKLRPFIPKLSSLKKEFSESPELLLGLATIYSNHSTSEEEYNESLELYKKALSFKPDNNSIRSAYVWRLTQDIIGKHASAFLSLEAKHKYAEEYKINKDEIPSYSDLYEYFDKDEQGKVYISDFNEAKATILEKLKPETQTALSELELAQKKEPDNALYNYLRAELYFNIGREDEAIKELEIGANRSHFDNHWIQIYGFSKAVLKMIKFPEQYIESLNDIPWPMYGLPNYTEFFELAKKKEEKGQKSEAIRIFTSFNKTTNQIKETSISEQRDIADRQKERNFYSNRIKQFVERKLTKSED